MKFGSNRVLVGALAPMIVSLLGAAPAAQARPQRIAQESSAQKPLMAEEAFKNVQLLRGISVKEFMETMGFFAASTGMNCTDCHVAESGGDWSKYADDIPIKQKARMMMLMMNAINKTYFAGNRQVTCYSCHRGGRSPKVIPNLKEQYSSPAQDDPDQILEQAEGAPSADQVLDKYIQAVGGTQRLATFTSLVGKGTYQGYDDPGKLPIEVYAKAPGQVAQIVHGAGGDSSWIDDGRSVWVAQPDTDAPVPVLALTAGDLDGAHVEAALFFPGRVKQLLTKWRVGIPLTEDDQVFTEVQGTTAGGNNVKLYFDPSSGLLMRMVRYTTLPVGLIPTQIDYADYRDVSGIKIPFRVTKTWVDGRSITEFSEVRPNTQIDATRFVKPATPVAPPVKPAIQ